MLLWDIGLVDVCFSNQASALQVKLSTDMLSSQVPQPKKIGTEKT